MSEVVMKTSIWKEIRTALKVARKEYFLKILTSLMIRGILLVIPLLFSMVINYVTNGKYNEAIILLVVSIIITGLYRFSEAINQVTYYNLHNKLFNYYSNLGIDKTNDNSLFSLSRFTSGSYSNIIINDIETISTFYTSAVIWVVQVVEFIVIYTYFLSLDIYVFLSAVIISIIMIIISIKSGKKVQKYNENKKSSQDKMNGAVFNYFNSIKEIKSYHILDKVKPFTSKEVNNYLKDNKKYIVKYNANNHSSLYVFEVFRLLTIIYSLFQVKSGIIEVGTLVLIYNYYQKIIDNFSTILTLNIETRNYKVSLNRFYQLVEYSKESKEGITIDKDEIKGDIAISNVLYGYRDNPTLDHASLTIKANSLTVLTGRDEMAQNGIVDLLLKLNRQHEGNITLDGIQIGDIDDDYYFDLVSSVRRQNNFFDMSIMKNLELINKDEEMITSICKRIGLEKEIIKLEKGYNTIMNINNNINQTTLTLIAIARLLLKESKVLIFDDIVNLLSKGHEMKLLELVKDMKKDHTIIIITNSKEIIAAADTVYDVHDKKVYKTK